MSPARRHFLGLAGAVTCKAAAIAALASTAMSSAAEAAPGGNGNGNGNGGSNGNGGNSGGGGGGGGGKCFLAGTRILTTKGEIPVEDLQIGNLVLTVRGETLPVKWIGKQVYRRSGPAWHRSVMPIRIAAGAIDHQTPLHDLYLSPNHALYIDGYLMPVKELVNGSSIRPALPSDQIWALHYFNVVFDTHEVICAEGTPVESFGDGNGIEDFTNFAEYKRLYPDEPCPAKTAVAPNLGRARAHLYALLGLAVSPLVKVRDPLQQAYERIATRAEEIGVSDTLAIEKAANVLQRRSLRTSDLTL
jgi:hypothetical protein